MSEPEAKSNILPFREGLDLEALGEPNPWIIEELEYLLAQSMAGKVQGFAFVTVDHEGAVITAFMGARRYTLLGGISRLSYRLNHSIDGE